MTAEFDHGHLYTKEIYERFQLTDPSAEYDQDHVKRYSRRFKTKLTTSEAVIQEIAHTTAIEARAALLIQLIWHQMHTVTKRSELADQQLSGYQFIVQELQSVGIPAPFIAMAFQDVYDNYQYFDLELQPAMIKFFETIAHPLV